MVKIAKRGIVLMADVEHCDVWVLELGFGRIAALYGDGRLSQQYGTGQKVVFVGTARVRDNCFNHSKSGKRSAVAGKCFVCENSNASYAESTKKSTGHMACA